MARYLFVSVGGRCDGENSTYTLYVGRSKNLTGSCLDQAGKSLLQGGGTVVLAANDTWVGPEYNSVVQDVTGTDWLFYHAIPRDDPRLTNGVNHRPALVDKLSWEKGWPVVNGGNGPSFTPQPVLTTAKP